MGSYGKISSSILKKSDGISSLQVSSMDMFPLSAEYYHSMKFKQRVIQNLFFGMLTML